MAKTAVREKGPKCINCSKSVEVGQVVLPWDDAGEMHANCEDPYSLSVTSTDDAPAPVVLLDRPMRHVPLALLSKKPGESEQELLTASTEALSAFSEGVVWNAEQRSAYNDLDTAVKRFSPQVNKFQPVTE